MSWSSFSSVWVAAFISASVAEAPSGMVILKFGRVQAAYAEPSGSDAAASASAVSTILFEAITANPISPSRSF